MKGWIALYLYHGVGWVALLALALVLKPVAQAPIIVMFLVASVPYLFVLTLGLSETSGLLSTLFVIYSAGWIVAGFLYVAIAERRWAKGKPTLARSIPHIGIAVVGLIALLFVGSINFPFSL